MSIAKMSLLEIVGPIEMIDDALISIQKHGRLHIEEVPLVVPGVRSFLHRQQLTDDEEKTLAVLKETLRMLSELLPLFKGGDYPEEDAVEAYIKELPSDDAELTNMRITRLKRRADSLWRKQSNISSDITTLESYREKLNKLNAIKQSSTFSESLNYIALLVNDQDKAASGASAPTVQPDSE